jgi:maltokinase
VTVDDLTRQVAASETGRLLPTRLEEAARLPATFTLAGAVALPGTDASLAVLRDEDGLLFAGPLLPSADDGLRRAQPGDGAAHTLAAALARSTPRDGGGFTTTRLLPDGSVEASRIGDAERPMLVDQTHESVVVGERAVVKWAVHAEPTPASVLVPHLSEAGFTAMPAPWGFVTWQDRSDPQEAPAVLVASVMDYLPEASDGWTWAVQDVGRWATGAVDRTSALEPMDDVGALVADLHVALATPTSFIPEPTTAADAAEPARWRSLAEALLSEAVEVVDGPEGEGLVALQDRVATTLATLDAAAGTVTMPVHGDLHVGQVLRWRGGYAVGDFDGNPVLPVPERLRPQPAARDVAGMLQSLDHVGRVVVRRVEGADAGVVEQWITDAQERFLSAYRRRLAESDAARLLDERLLLPFRVEQECREFLYAVRHLPRWRYVPDQALQALFPGG